MESLTTWGGGGVPPTGRGEGRYLDLALDQDQAMLTSWTMSAETEMTGEIATKK